MKNNLSVDLSLQYLRANLKDVSSPTLNYETGQMSETIKSGLDDVRIFVGFSVYL